MAFGFGLIIPFQAGVNNELAKAMGHPIPASLGTFIVGALAVLMIVLVGFLRQSLPPFPSVQTLISIPWWMWLGGALSTLYILTTMVVAPKLGGATTFALIVTGQMLSCLVFDHFGWMNFPVHPVNIWRLCGVGLLLVSIVIIQNN